MNQVQSGVVTVKHFPHNTKVEVEPQHYTLYWKDGIRCVIRGETLESAFTSAGYKADAVDLIDWFDGGVTETHYWDRGQQQWVKYKPMSLFHDAKIFSLPEDQQIIAVMNYLMNYHTVNVELPGKNLLSISIENGLYIFGWVRCIRIEFGEYHPGTYGGDSADEKNSCHYMACAPEHYKMSDMELAAKAFVKRLQNPGQVSGEPCMTIQEIHAVQHQ